MRTTKKRARKRCSECRRWFEPSRTAERSQKTCSRRCREKRQRKLSKRRRKRDLEGYRADERQRQSDFRERRREQVDEGVKNPQVSRATLSQQDAVLKGEIVKNWDRQMELSRARFERRIGHLLGRAGQKLGQTGTRIGDCHAPP